MSQEIEWLLKEKYHGEKSDAFFADCKRLALGEPVGYLIGHIPFLGCTIRLDSKPLIPRPETEFWTEEAIARIVQSKLPTPRILDLCAGSGCIGVAVARAVPNAHVDFSEIDQSHLPTIKKNATGNGIEDNRYAIHHTNLFESLTGTFDFILSNPPYIDAALKRTDESVVRFEPYVALFGGKDGMEVITDIITRAPKYLNPHGELWLEHEPEQTAAIRALGEKQSFFSTVYKDQYGVNRFSVLVLQ